MTPPLAPTLPPWPERDDYKPYACEPDSSDASRRYAEALAAAWEARARLAVRQLISATSNKDNDGWREWDEANRWVLERIGPLSPSETLPDLPTAEKGE